MKRHRARTVLKWRTPKKNRFRYGSMRGIALAVLGRFTVTRIEGYDFTRLPFFLFAGGAPVLRAHGQYTGYQRFGSLKAAKTWVECRISSDRRELFR